ncbi:MAG TPA: hypothetical protein VNE00_02525 [Paraburkholderia sp.]|jgi:hypothetical protein|nr:hypothetical protein [Paraburkholderia sp.]
MLSEIIRRVVGRFAHSSEKSAARTYPETPAEFQIDPVWHGDHWQNLLSSPMDARHYVMEDWSVAPGFEWKSAANPSRG